MLDNTKYWVQWRFHKDVAAADAALEMTQRRPPAGWYPDPADGSAMRYWDGSR